MAKPTAIIVDDDRNLSEIFSIALDAAGFATERVMDSRRALERIAAQKPDLITLDMQMPYLSGDEILRQIRADETLKAIKVIMITANSRVAEVKDIERLADVILIKPVTLSQVMNFAKRLIQDRGETNETP
jgi:two-component system alkaline phosphatase synthesis response regulator PhoP